MVRLLAIAPVALAALTAGCGDDKDEGGSAGPNKRSAKLRSEEPLPEDPAAGDPGQSARSPVTAPDAGLPPEYALVGRVVKGMEVVDAISEQGDPASGGNGTPLMPVVIEKAKVGGR